MNDSLREGTRTVLALAGLLLTPVSALANGYTVRNAIVVIAKDQIGDPYVLGAEGPDEFDCSGLVWYAYSNAGVTGSRTTAEDLWNRCDSIAGTGSLLPGDLVFYDKNNDNKADTHVGIWVGNNQVVDAEWYTTPQGQEIKKVDIHNWGWDSGFELFGRMRASYWPGNDNGYTPPPDDCTGVNFWDLWVVIGGSGSNCGTFDDPFTSLTTAIENAKSDGWITIKPGNPFGTGTLNPNGKTVHLRPETGHSVTLGP